MRYGGTGDGTYGGAGRVIASPTFTGVSKGQPYVLYESAIPFICLSSGSVSAAGAISGITALRIAYPNAYCYFPANALSASSAAGWYYCTFSGTQAGTAFLNTYTSGQPTIPASPTAVTAGQGAFTGVSTAVFGPIINVPANGLGVNGTLDYTVETSMTNSVGSKVLSVTYSGSGGTNLTNLALTTQLGQTLIGRIRNRGAANVQASTYISTDYGAIVRAASPTAMQVDTTAATTLQIGLTKVAADNLVVESLSATAKMAASGG